MNTYEENLKSTAIATLSALSVEKDKLESVQTAEHYKLYYAQGAQLTAMVKLGDTGMTLTSVGETNTECLADDNDAVNLLATATTANGNVATGNANMSTAASNVQIASNAIAAVAAEIGAALNNATASLHGSNVYNKLTEANSLINEVANESRSISELAMMASSHTSEIIAGPVLAQATTLKGKVDNLLKATQAEFDKFNALYVAEKAALAQASIAERQEEGLVKDADSEAQAIEQAFQNANAQLNLGLTVSGISANTTAEQPTCTITGSFEELVAPAFPTSDVKVPPMVQSYYAVIVPDSSKATLTTDLAEQLFNSLKDEPGSPFMSVSKPGTLNIMFDQDVFQKPIQPGQDYVVFVYAVLQPDYKFFINNYSDWLSAPSAPFTVAATLPTASTITLIPHPAIQDSPLSVTFNAPLPTIIEGNTFEYRCILVLESDEISTLALMTEPPSSTALPKVPSPIFFDRDIALQVAPANYEKRVVIPKPKEDGAPASNQPPAAAGAAPAASDSAPAATGADATAASQATAADPAGADATAAAQATTGDPAPALRLAPAMPYKIGFNSSSTDNFGNPLQPGATYRPYILATVCGKDEDAYVSTLAWGEAVPLIQPAQPK